MKPFRMGVYQIVKFLLVMPCILTFLQYTPIFSTVDVAIYGVRLIS